MNKKRVLEEWKSYLLMSELQATHELGGQNVVFQNITTIETQN